SISTVDEELAPVESRNDGEAPAAVEQSSAVAAPAKKKGRSPILPVIGLALLASGAWYGYHWWTDGRFMVSTEDAYIEGDIAIISPKVSGYVASVTVSDNQIVKAGDPLVVL